MSMPEQPQQGNPEFKLILPSLPTPYEGVYEEVYAEYLDDPDKFSVGLEYRLETENPNLLSFFLSGDYLTPNSNISYKWAALYYEMFARSSKKEGLPPLLVSDQTLNTYLQRSYKSIGEALDLPLFQRAEFSKALEDISKRNRANEEAYSPELAKFWRSVDQDIRSEIDFGASGEEIGVNLLRVRSIQEVLHKQNNEYEALANDISRS